ncbi:MAG: amino acid adenylation domain-containing protein, partial [Desulfuromonadales bacterium]
MNFLIDLHPDDTAIIFNGQAWTFLEVEKRANRLARYLKTLGIGPGHLVGLLLDRSEKPIISILAILKAGAGYVPVDPVYPDERIYWIFKNSDIDTVITDVSLVTRVGRDFDGNRILIDEQNNLVENQSCERVPPEISRVSPEDICYVIYTSGTTGRPKGVVTEHRNACCFVESFRDVCNLTPQDRVYQGFSLGFDGSVEEIWMAFSSGAALVIADSEACKLGSEAASLINLERVTYFSTVPTFLSMIKEDLPTVKLLVLSGEVCPPELVSRWATPERRMLNAYGPTEATVNTTVEECSPGIPITIGKPIKTYETYILGPNLQPVGYEETGELFIGGPALARGYLNQPEQTDRQFISTPGDHPIPHKRLYRTGDLAKYDRDGKLLFLGRIDSQVKIRGFRIEIAEIEAVLREHPLVEVAAVKVIDSGGIKQLAAFVTLSEPQATLDRDSILELVQSRLPHYMVPACLDVVDRIPTLASGKIARKLLPNSAAPLVKGSRTIIEPSTLFDKRVVTVFVQVFKIRPISVEDD